MRTGMRWSLLILAGAGLGMGQGAPAFAKSAYAHNGHRAPPAHNPAPASASALAPAAQAAPIIPAETSVRIAFLSTLSSATSHPGDLFPIRLAEALTRDGRVLVPAGALGLGEVVEAKPAGGAGKPGVLILAARYLEANGHQIPLHGLAQDPVGRDRVGAAKHDALHSISMIVPTTMLGLATSGGDTMVPRGGEANARVASAVDLGAPVVALLPAPWPAPALSGEPRGAPARITPARITSARTPPARDVEPLPEGAELSVPAPPPGYGQVVFYRPGSIMWRVIGCTVREEDHKVSSLGSGRWFALVTRPGVHAFRVTGETSDTLRLDVEPGETQYVSCRMRASILIARPFIRPETPLEFHRELPDLRVVSDDDMGPRMNAADEAGLVLRRDDLRLALAQRGDVRGRLASANRGVEQNGVLETADSGTRTVLRQGVAKLAKEAAK